MTQVARRDLPADIALVRGRFASQPLAFAHLLDAAPTLDLGHVEVVAASGAQARLTQWFEAPSAQRLAESLTVGECLIVVLPRAYEGHTCPLGATEHLQALGVERGIVPHLSLGPDA